MSLIVVRTTKECLAIQLELNGNRYETGPKVSDEEMETPSIGRATLHGRRNYTLALRPPNDYG